MTTIVLRFVYVGLVNAASGESRQICPEPGCGRNNIPYATADDPFRLGGETIKNTLSTHGFNLLGMTQDFESEAAAQQWLETKDGKDFLSAFKIVVLIRAHK